MTAYILAWRMRRGLDGTRIPFTRALRFGRGIARRLPRQFLPRTPRTWVPSCSLHSTLGRWRRDVLTQGFHDDRL